MDRVRFGRALGQGTREAAKALLKAADAVASPNPGAAPASTPRSAAKPREQIVRGAVQQTKPSRAGLKRGGKQFGEAVWKPFARLSGVLWLEFTGVFFALFAFTAGIEVWRAALGPAAGNARAPGGMVRSGDAVGVWVFCRLQLCEGCAAGTATLDRARRGG